MDSVTLYNHYITTLSLTTCRRGQVLAATVNEQTMVPFVSQQLNNLELALSLAKRGNLPGAEALVGQNFDRLFASGQFKEAAEAAAESPQVSHHVYWRLFCHEVRTVLSGTS